MQYQVYFNKLRRIWWSKCQNNIGTLQYDWHRKQKVKVTCLCWREWARDHESLFPFCNPGQSDWKYRSPVHGLLSKTGSLVCPEALITVLLRYVRETMQALAPWKCVISSTQKPLNEKTGVKQISLITMRDMFEV